MRHGQAHVRHACGLSPAGLHFSTAQVFSMSMVGICLADWASVRLARAVMRRSPPPPVPEVLVQRSMPMLLFMSACVREEREGRGLWIRSTPGGVQPGVGRADKDR